MKIEHYGNTASVISEEKLIEVIPVIETASGEPFMLPPVVWPVPNELLGYVPEHVQAMPYVVYMQERAVIYGSTTAAPVRLGFLVRVMEGSPSSEPRQLTTVSPEDVAQILRTIVETQEDFRFDARLRALEER